MCDVKNSLDLITKELKELNRNLSNNNRDKQNVSEVQTLTKKEINDIVDELENLFG